MTESDHRDRESAGETRGATGFDVYDSRPWLRFYSEGAITDLGEQEHDSFGAMIRAASETHADKAAFTACLPTGTTGTLTFAEVDALSDRFAAYLRFELGLDKGERVAIQSPNCLGYPIVVFGTAKAGCVLVNINPLYTVPEIDHTLTDSGARVLVMIDMFGDKLAQVIPGSQVEHVLVHSVADFFPGLRRFIVKTVQKFKKMVPRIDAAHQSLTRAIDAGGRQLDQGRSLSELEVGLDDLLALQYTGGTTGPAKGAMLTHRNFVANCVQSRNNILQHLPENRTALTALPLYHIFALGVCGIYFSVGGHNILIPSPRPPANLKPAFEKFDVTFFSGVNTLFNALLNEEWFRSNPPQNLNITIGGGAAVLEATAERWNEQVGYPIYQAYGLTETSPAVTTNPMERPKATSIGIPLASTWVRLVDDDGRPVPQGEAGELLVKGPQVMDGYWNRPEATAEAMRDGWFATGDIATMDADGYFYIVDRKKDMINVSGFNVFPNEVEDAIARHPGVREVGVVGVPDEESGEAVRAYVVKADESLTEEAIREHCQQYITKYKLPKQVIFRDSIPQTPVGKVLRKDLRAEALKEIQGE